MDDFPVTPRELVECPSCARWIETAAGWCRCGYSAAGCVKPGDTQPDVRTGRRIVYVAGPISKGDLADNINRANRAFRVLALAGLSPLVPQWSCFSGGALVAPTSGAVYALATSAGCDLPHATWVAIDLAFVERSDAVLRLPGESTGADRETAHARALGIPVFDSIDGLLCHFGITP